MMKNYLIGLQVTDGAEASEISFLKIATFQPEFYLENNTGLLLNYNNSSLITVSNISIVTNFEDSLFDVEFEIKTKPKFGVIELEESTQHNQWSKVDHFSYKQLKQLRVRYRHFTDKPDFDEFKVCIHVITCFSNEYLATKIFFIICE